MNLKILMTLTLGMSQSLSLVFRHKINEARCQATCLTSAVEDRIQCEEVCGILQRDPEAGENLCSLTSMCEGGCRAACDAEVTRSPDTLLRITEVKMESCELSWETEAAGNVVFVVAGKDQAGMWSLVRDAVTETKLELSVTLAARMVEIVVFAVTGEMVDRVSLDISDNTCEETEPEVTEWKDKKVDTEETERMSYILLVTIILATVSVIIALLIVMVIIFKMRRARTLKEAAHCYETIPYPTYTFHTSRRAQDNFYLESPISNSFILNLEEADGQSYSEKLQSPRLITTITEQDDEYEEVY